MEYLLLVYSPENSWTQQEWTQCVVESSAICHELACKQQFCSATPLHPVASALTVRNRSQGTLVTTGPFAETTEQLGGYFLINVESLDDAIEIAARLPAARKGTIEIRPTFSLSGLPNQKTIAEVRQANPKLRMFLFLCYDDEQAWKDVGPTVHEAAMKQAAELCHTLDQNNHYLFATPLCASTTATCVRVQSNGSTTITDGPYAETREVLGGFYIIAAEDGQQAAKLAEGHPGLRFGAVEVREVFEIPAIPTPNALQIMTSGDLPFTKAQVTQAFECPDAFSQWWLSPETDLSVENWEFHTAGQGLLQYSDPSGRLVQEPWRFLSVTDDEIQIEHQGQMTVLSRVTLQYLPENRCRLTWLATYPDAIARVTAEKDPRRFDQRKLNQLTHWLSNRLQPNFS